MTGEEKKAKGGMLYVTQNGLSAYFTCEVVGNIMTVAASVCETFDNDELSRAAEAARKANNTIRFKVNFYSVVVTVREKLELRRDDSDLEKAFELSKNCCATLDNVVALAKGGR